MTHRLTLIATAFMALAACSEPAVVFEEDEIGGDVKQTWEPATVESVKQVPVAALRAAITSRLAGEAPEPLTKESWEHATRLYTQFAGGPLWLSEDGLERERAGYLLRALANSDTDALMLSSYPLGALGQALNAIDRTDTPTAEQLAEADVLLTAAYAALGEDMLTGEIDPREVSQSWHIDPQEERVDSALARTLRSEPLDRAITYMRPQDEGYAALQKAIVGYRQIVGRGGWPMVPEGKALKPRQTDAAARIAALHQRLKIEGYEVDAAPGTAYTPMLAAAVALFQTRHGIAADSTLGPETVKSLNVTAEQRTMQIAANLERYRWLPRRLGHKYIFVNVPAFRMEGYERGKKTIEMKVIVGSDYEGRSTPVFSDTMQYVVFRPYWNVTDDIANQEILPKIAADPSYMARNNYEFFQSGGQRRVRQKPGEENSLGLVKFMFPNDFNIYLHDTPNDALFEKDARAFSHGCIRLERPEELAQWVLGWDAGKVESAMNGSRNNWNVTLPTRIPVYIAYFTTYERDGALFFSGDLYSRDDDLAAKVRQGALPDPASVRAATTLREIADSWTK